MQQTKFKIVIPSYNNEKWCEYNLASIINQTNTNYDVLYIDDCSTDGTYEKVNAIVGNLPNWKVVKNLTNKRRGYNTSPYNPDILEFMDSDEDVLIFVDGDDWLFEDETLDKIDRYYKTNDVWMTYGQYINYPSLRLGTEILHGTPYSNETHKLKNIDPTTGELHILEPLSGTCISKLKSKIYFSIKLVSTIYMQKI